MTTNDGSTSGGAWPERETDAVADAPMEAILPAIDPARLTPHLRGGDRTVEAAPLDLDPTQQVVLAAPDRVLHVVGAAGTGKTTLAVEFVARAVDAGARPDECVILSPTRVAAGSLRERVTTRVAGTSSEPIARTPQALAFGILRLRAVMDDLPAPRLLAGPEQDVVLKELLEGHRLGLGAVPDWPDDLAEALTTRGFRNELRDLIMRAVEWDISSDELRHLGVEHARPEWVAAADVLDEYDDVTALARPGAFDPAWILGAAAQALRENDTLREQLRTRLRLVVIDDAQELTRAAVGFLEQLVGPTQRLVLLGNPDVTVQAFRGADPRYLADVAEQHGATRRFVLGYGHRQPRALAQVLERVTARIGSVDGIAHRSVETRLGGTVDVALLRSSAQEAAHIAGVLRRAHLKDGVAWKDMAVIVRGSAGTSALRRALNAAKVPVAVAPASLALRDEPAVRPFLHALEIVTGLQDDASAPAAALDGDGVVETESDLGVGAGDGPGAAPGARPSVSADLAIDLLTSPLGGADPVVLRRLRRALRREELAAGGERTSDELLGACLLESALLASLGPEAAPARRVARVLGAGARALRATPPHDDAEHVLWQMWQASGLAEAWEANALAGGIAGTRADRDLDALLALFAAAGTFVERLPGAGVADFLDHVRGQDVPGDRLVAAAPDEDAVALVTAAGSAGSEWHTVVVAGVQEGVWPDLRLRGSVLGSEDLVDILSGRGRSLPARQAAVRYDETRQFAMALSRAREHVVVTAVRDEDEQPSVYLDIVDPLAPDAAADTMREFTPVARPMTLAGLVAEARRMLADPTEAVRHEGARRLARLAEHDVPGADPEQWWALVAQSDDRPLRPPQEWVRVSPSKIEGFHRCALNWLLTTNGGFGPSRGASTIGTLVHELAQEFGDTDPSLMDDALEERWPRLGLGTSWVSRGEKARTQNMVRKLQGYLADAKAAGWTGEAAERGFNAVVGRAKISGSIDRLEVHPDRGLRVIDYKTGGSKPKDEELAAHPQLAAYQAAVEAGAFGAGRTSAGAALVQVGEAAGKGPRSTARVQVQPPLAEDDVEDDDAGVGEDDVDAGGEPAVGTRRWAFELMQRTADGMGAATFLAAANPNCSLCPVRSSCPIQPEGRTL